MEKKTAPSFRVRLVKHKKSKSLYTKISLGPLRFTQLTILGCLLVVAGGWYTYATLSKTSVLGASTYNTEIQFTCDTPINHNEGTCVSLAVYDVMHMSSVVGTCSSGYICAK